MAGEPIIPKEVSGPPQWLSDRKRNAISDCSMFYAGKKKPVTESLMCFSWECGPGWNDVLAQLSYNIETLNLTYYPKFRVYCEAEQIKEKFGTLRVYYRIVTDPPAWRTFLPKIVQRLIDWISAWRVDYKKVKVVDVPRHSRYEYKQLSKEDFDKAAVNKYKCSNEKYLKDSDRYYRVLILDRYEQSHMEPCAHKFLYATLEFLRKIHARLSAFAVVEPTRKQQIVAEYFSDVVRKYEVEAERECYCRCEKCGAQIGDSWNPRCETKGWIQYICEKCAKSGGNPYIVHKTTEKKEIDNEDKN